MCIAIVKPAGVDIKKSVLSVCAENNPDGCGFAYINTDNNGVRRIKTKKAMEFDEFYEKYSKAVESNPESPFLIHFRIQTHGNVDLANCHPFRINRKQVFIHNGVIRNVDKDEDMSDTRVFNRDVLRVLPKNWNGNTGLKKLIEEFIGHSKLCVMDISGKVNIYNEDAGEWVDGVWYSNDSYEYRPVVPAYGRGTTSSDYHYAFSEDKKVPFYNRGVGGKTINIGEVKSRANTLKRVTPFVTNAYVPCDMCGVYHCIDTMESYYHKPIGSTPEVICFCKSCGKNPDIWMKFDVEDLLSPDAHVDWLNEGANKSVADTAYYHEDIMWYNPWITSEDEELEMMEGNYEHVQALATT